MPNQMTMWASRFGRSSPESCAPVMGEDLASVMDLALDEAELQLRNGGTMKIRRLDARAEHAVQRVAERLGKGNGKEGGG